MRARLFAIVWLSLLHGCGVQQVELTETNGEVIVLDDVSQDAQDRLRHAKPGKPEPRLGLRYPADHAAVPANVPPLTFLFASEAKGKMEPMEPMAAPMAPMAPAGEREIVAYELRLRGAEGELYVYTGQTSATLPLERWRRLLARQEGADLTLVVRALTAAMRVSESAPMTLRVRAETEPGQLSYWSDLRGVALTVPVDEPLEALREGALFPSLEPWESVSQEGQRRALTRTGLLSIEQGSVVSPIAWATSEQLDYPDWSPDGSALVLVAGAPAPTMEPMMPKPMPMESPEAGSARLVRVAVVDGRVEMPEQLFSVEKADESLRAPTYSADGKLIAFEKLKGRERTGQLLLWSERTGALEPGAMKLNWNGRGAFPGWIPSRDPRERWLVFSQPLAPGDGKLPEDQLQLWCVGLTEREDGMIELLGEPYWLPMQNLTDSNRRALFSR